eukprot:4781977-Pyramimonas_sp.AAC.1
MWAPMRPPGRPKRRAKHNILMLIAPGCACNSHARGCEVNSKTHLCKPNVNKHLLISEDGHNILWISGSGYIMRSASGRAVAPARAAAQQIQYACAVARCQPQDPIVKTQRGHPHPVRKMGHHTVDVQNRMHCPKLQRARSRARVAKYFLQ